jgi:hypothetical protein
MPKLYSFPWHNDDCVHKPGSDRIERDGRKVFFCETHGQWASEVPVKKTVVYEYGDGNIQTMEFRTKGA